jgi:hypothetical protein
MTNTKIIAATLGLIAYGWAATYAAETRNESGATYYDIIVRSAPAVEAATPIADSLVDWDEHERQTECLWKFLGAHGVELTLQTVLAAGDWTDALGGACQVIGEDDEEQG